MGDVRPTQRETTGRRAGALVRGVEHLSPGYFALVMGTGIVSTGLDEVGLDLPSRVLLVIAALGYVLLWVCYVWRAVSYGGAVLRDLRAPETAFAYFTVVAATDVLAVRLVGEGLIHVSMPMIAFAAVLWFVFGYVLPWQVLMRREGKSILARINGTWFIWAVASQSLAVGLATIQPFVTVGRDELGIVTVLSWSVGVALYLAVFILTLLRLVHFGITPQQLEPPYWVMMGAMAIAVVAGSRIVDMTSTPMVDATRSFVGATVAIFWSICLWLIPMLVGAGVWRHVVHRVPLRYTPALWSIVFPVGMFSVASMDLGRVDSLPIVEQIGHGALVVAVLVWAVVLVAMLRHGVLTFRRGTSSRGD